MSTSDVLAFRLKDFDKEANSSSKLLTLPSICAFYKFILSELAFTRVFKSSTKSRTKSTSALFEKIRIIVSSISPIFLVYSLYKV